MSTATAAGSPTWTRWAPGSAVLLFIFLSGGLWFGSLAAYEIGLSDFVAVLMALAAFLPLLWLGVRLRARPVWALRVPGERERVAMTLREAVQDLRPSSVWPSGTGHVAVFRGCDPLFRIEDPACLVGARCSSEEPGSVILLLPLSRGREPIARLRAAIGKQILAEGPVPSAA